jgi:hypothetical protein
VSGTAGEKKGDYSGGPGRPADARRLRAGQSQQGHRGAATTRAGFAALFLRLGPHDSTPVLFLHLEV